MQKFDSINVIPFIDIMLVLLAIVLTTATFVSTGQLDIALPESSAESAAIEKEVVELAIDRDEKIYLNGKLIQLVEVKRYLRSIDNNTQVTLLIDETVEFRHFISLIDLLKDHSPNKISIRTRTAP